MPYLQVQPVIDEKMRDMCVLPYSGGSRGCPNYGRKPHCPPAAPLLADLLVLSEPVYAVYHIFDVAAQAEKMRAKHPEWTERQLRNSRFWQQTAQAGLRKEIEVFRREHPECTLVLYPEATGVNIQATMAQVGIELEWPPRKVAYKIALAGIAK